MALAALIFASESVDDGSEMLRAALPLAGATLLEHQVRRVVRAGASHVVILVERMPAAILNAIDRLRRDGTRIDIARTVVDAADRIHPAETVIVVADGCIADAAAFQLIAAARAPALLTHPDKPGLEDFERVDANNRWIGLALVDGPQLQATANRLGEWDFALTLLRRALQDGAAMIPAAGAAGGALDVEKPIFAREADDLSTLEQRIIDGSAGLREGWTGKYIFPILERPGFARLVRSDIDPWWLGIGAIVLAALAVPLMAFRWLMFPGLILLILSGPAASIARRLADVRITKLRHERLLSRARQIIAGAAMITLGIRLGDDGQWGWALLSVTVVVIMVALSNEWRTAQLLDNRAAMPFMASVDGLIWLFIPFAIFGLWGTAIMASAIYALTSFVVAQRLVHDAIAAKMRGQQV